MDRGDAHGTQHVKDQKEVEHLVYLTEKRVEIARAAAQRRAAEAEAQRLNDEREQVVIEARTHEAEHARQEAEQAAARAKQLEQELADLKAKQTEHGLVLTLGDVLFADDKAELKAGALRNLYQLVTFLKEILPVMGSLKATLTVLVRSRTTSTSPGAGLRLWRPSCCKMGSAPSGSSLVGMGRRIRSRPTIPRLGASRTGGWKW